ncbi:putative neprosin [Lupinus albus]|uniref:Putative neprosin n=1 Tax=Lupinus albus TaxID=3870 RepID=A0A6A4NWQ0_LUPAL|nr:putative neprosin [Lupinus albus]
MIGPSIHMSMLFVVLLFFVTSNFCRAIENQTNELDKLSRIRAQLEKINKPPIKTINSPDGDIIDCVLFHDQPAFDLPELKDQNTTLELPEWPMGFNNSEDTTIRLESIQLWSTSGEECPQGTIPILRTTEQHLLRESNMTRFGQKIARDGHEYATTTTRKDQYYGARTYVNVWAPITNRDEFSLAQMWLVSGSYQEKDLNTIEVGWQVFPRKYGGNNPRLFAFWTRDAYQSSGCYNLLCPGFVQVNKRIALGAAITPISSYNGKQFEISLMVWKDPKNGNWWLSFGSGILIGYWPSSLFTRLKSHANFMQFGGEITNFAVNGHTTTQMGSGHFAERGFRKAALFRSLGFVNSFNKLSPIPVTNLQTYAGHPNCYDIKVLSDDVYGTHFYYGGPGKNPRCP